MIFPKVGKANIGLTTSFICNNTEMTEWYFSRQYSIPENSIPLLSESKKLIIKDVNLTNVGYYFCFGRHKKGSQYLLAMAELQVYGMLILMLINRYKILNFFVRFVVFTTL